MSPPDGISPTPHVQSATRSLRGRRRPTEREAPKLSMRIAILDDDDIQVQFIAHLLGKAGFNCHGFLEGKVLLRRLRRESFDLLILDWSVPDISGTEVLAWVRAHLTQRIPVLFVTGRTSENDIVSGLSAGADDYMIKPLRGPELVARVQALLRRAYPEAIRDQIGFGPYRFETSRNEVHFQSADGHQRIALLTQKEFDLALMLFRNVGRPLSRSHIREAVWGRDIEIPSRTMDTHISRIRSKLELRPEMGYRLVPVYSYGYRLDAAGHEDEAEAAALGRGARARRKKANEDDALGVDE